jgi:hypothetical protein
MSNGITKKEYKVNGYASTTKEGTSLSILRWR